jgi:hypothetical protein
LAQGNHKVKQTKTACVTEKVNVTCRSKWIHKISNARPSEGVRQEHTAEIPSIHKTHLAITLKHGKQWEPSSTFPQAQHMMLDKLKCMLQSRM